MTRGTGLVRLRSLRSLTRLPRPAPRAILVVPLATVAFVAGVPATAGSGGAFELRAAKVRAGTAYFAGSPLTIRFKAADDRERLIRVAIVNKRSRKAVHDWRLPTFTNLTEYPLRWRGKTARRIAPNGRYVVRAGPDGRPLRRIGGFKWRRHAYPVAGPHSSRGYLGEFGAPRNGGRTHEGFDILSPCGTPLVAARGGKVLKSRFDPRLMGNFVIIRGRRDRFRYLYAHLRGPSPMKRGDRVRTNQLVGHVGQTGNAGSTPCHLHFELRDHGPVDPEPFVRRWDR